MSKLIKQGSYGCIFKPGIKCDGTIESKKYISKIQKKKARTENEPIIGKMITEKLEKTHERYFAPALNVCNVSLSVLKKGDIQKCKAINKEDDVIKDEYVSIKLRFVGKETLESNINRHFERDYYSFLMRVIDTHLYLECALEELVKMRIIHFDLKGNNVMFSEQMKVPIIIDFGMSFEMKNLYSDERLKTIFFSDYEKYPPWCMDIVFISHIIKSNKWDTKTVKVTELEKIIDIFFNKNPVAIALQNTVNIGSYKSKWKQYVRTFENKKGKSVVNALLENWKTWDSYSVNVMVLSFIESSGVIREKNQFVNEYVKHITNQLLSIPAKRNNPTEEIESIETLLSNVKKTIFLENTKTKGKKEKWDPSVISNV